MNDTIRIILDELYAIDPDLRPREAELVPLIELIIRQNPGREPDERFVQELRTRLQERAAVLASSSSSSRPASFSSLFSFFSMNPFSYALGGAVVTALVAVPAVYLATRGLPQTGAPATGPLFSYSVTDTSDRAFGDLSVNTRDQSGGGGGEAAAHSYAMGAGGGNPVMDAKMIAPDLVQYDYVFKGTMPELTDKTVGVLKAEKNTGGTVRLSALLSHFNLGPVDLGTFGDAMLDNVSFIQDKPFGYFVSAQLREGSVSISANYERWPHPESACTDEACFRRFRLSPSDIPADDVLIGIANAFAKEHGIDLSHYGAPEVMDDTWRREYELATDKSQVYVPEAQQVVYPLLMDGKTVYEEGGQKAGLSISVHAKEKKVSDVWGLRDHRYLRSNYDAVTDAATIQKYLTTVDRMPTEYLPEGGKIRAVTVELGDPVAGYARVYTFKDNRNEELLVPALLFPVKNAPPNENVWRQGIVVPLANDILSERTRMQPVPID